MNYSCMHPTSLRETRAFAWTAEQIPAARRIDQLYVAYMWVYHNHDPGVSHAQGGLLASDRCQRAVGPGC